MMKRISSDSDSWWRVVLALLAMSLWFSLAVNVDASCTAHSGSLAQSDACNRIGSAPPDAPIAQFEHLTLFVLPLAAAFAIALQFLAHLPSTLPYLQGVALTPPHQPPRRA
jgi:hypothetical protein